MSYDYAAERYKVLTPEGQKQMFSIRRRMEEMIEYSGVVTLGKATSNEVGDSWTMMACVDYLVEMGEFVEVGLTGHYAGQDRIFRNQEE